MVVSTISSSGISSGGGKLFILLLKIKQQPQNGVAYAHPPISKPGPNCITVSALLERET